MSNRILVPKSYRENKWRLLFSMSGLNREQRRLTRLSNEDLVKSVLDPRKRLRRFWAVWWPIKPGSPRPVFWASIDLIALTEYLPAIRTQACDEMAIKNELDLLEIDEDVLRSSLPPEARGDFRFNLRPFAAWPLIKSLLANWPNLPESDRGKVVGALFALDGISFSVKFSEVAIRLQPACAEFFEDFVLAPDETGQDLSEQEGGGSDVQSGEHAPEVIWRGHWAALRQIAQEAIDGAIGSGPVVSAEAEIRALHEVVANRDERLRGSVVLLEEFSAAFRDAGQKLALWGSPILHEADQTIAAVRRAIEAGKSGDVADRVGRATASIVQFLVQANEHARRRQEAAERVAELDKRLAGAALSTDRIALLREKKLLGAAVGDEEISLAETCEQINASISSLLDDVGGGADTNEGLPDDPAAPEVPPVVQLDDVGRQPSGLSGDVSIAKVPPAPEVGHVEVEGEERTVAAAISTSPAPDEAPPGRSSSGDAMEGDTLPPADDPDTFSEAQGELCKPIWRALHADRPAIAHWLADAILKQDPTIHVPPPALLRAVALAGSVQHSHGEVARELADCYVEFDKAVFDTGPTEWREALSILLISATLRPCLVAPGTGATAVVLYAHPSGSVHALRQLVVETGNRLQGLAVGPMAFRQVGGVAGWEREWDTLQKDLSDWRKRASRYTLKFGRANDVWRHLISERGEIGRLLGMLEQKSAETAVSVGQALSDLADPQQLRRTINNIDRREIGGRRVQDIHAGALKQLEEGTSEALEFAQRWSDLIGRMPNDGNFTLRTLEAFRHEYAQLRDDLGTEIESLNSQHSRWGLISAASASLRSALRDLDELLIGSTRSADRRNLPGRIIGLPLLHIPSIELGEDWKPLNPPDAMLAALAPFADAPVDWFGTFEARLASGDAWACREVVCELEDLSEPRAEDLGRALDQGVAALRTNLGTKLREARRDLEAALAYGYIEEPARGNLDAELAGLEARLEEIERIKQAEDVIAGVRKVLQENKARRLVEVEGEADALGLDEASSAMRRLRRVIAAGDVFSAHEYLQRIKSGEDIPEDTNPKMDAFQSFFPETAGKIDALLDSKEFSIQQLKAALLDGRAIEGLDFSRVGREQRESARSMLDAWYALKRSQSSTGTSQSIRDVLAGLGFAGAKPVVRNQTRDKWEVELTGQVIADRSICPAPSFGSQAQGRYRAIFVWGKPADEDLPRIVGDTSGSAPTIVLYLGRLRERQRRELARVTRATGASFLVLDEILMLHLCAEPGSRLGVFFSCALPFSTVKPFVTTSGLVPPEMFFGRTEELKAVTDRGGRCFVYGGRQLGKTALLRAAERAFHQPGSRQFAAWIDLKAAGIGSAIDVDNVWSVIYRRLRELDPQFFGELPDPATGRRSNAVEVLLAELKRKFAPERGARLLLLLDEADRFLEQDSRKQYHETGRLKNLMESTDRGFKVVFAGLHNVLRTTEQVNHPLAHFGDPVEIGPFSRPSEWNEARNMVRGPLLAAGYQLVSDDLVVRILAQTNYYPVLIQLYGEQLVRILHDSNRQRLDVSAGPRYPVSEALVDEAYRERSLREAIRARFQYTLQLDQRYEVIAYSLAWALMEGTASFGGGASSKELRDWAVYWWPEGFGGVGDHEFRIILDEMVGLGVLRHVDDRRYSLRNPNLLRLLGGNEELGTVLTRKRETPVEFEPTIFRASDPHEQSGPHRSPLTFTQEKAFFADEHGVSLVVGNRAAGMDDLERFLDGRGGALQWKRRLTNLNEFGRLLEARREEGNTVLVIPPEVPWNDAWIRSALDRVRKLTSRDRKLRIVFLSDPAMLWQLMPALPQLDAVGLKMTPLRPWNGDFLSHWLDDMHITGNSESLRRDLADITGLWPSVLLPLPRPCHQLSDLINAAKKKLASVDARDSFLDELGLPEGEARAVLRMVKEFPDEPLENLEALAPDMGVAPSSVGSRLLWAEHLQLTQRSGKDSWRIEPYLASLIASVPND